MTHTCLKSPFLPLSEYTTKGGGGGGGEVTACKNYERKTAKMAPKPGFAPRWHILIGAERYQSRPNMNAEMCKVWGSLPCEMYAVRRAVRSSILYTHPEPHVNTWVQVA